MKTRIFGYILVLAVLAALYVVFEDNNQPQVMVQPVNPSDNGLKDLKIN